MDYNIGTNSAINPVRLAAMGAKFEKMSRQLGKFAQFFREVYTSNVKDIEPIGDANNPKFSGAPFEVWQDLSGAPGGDRVRIPIIGRLTKQPLGDTEAEGLGETIPIVFRTLDLAYYRKPMRKPTKMQKQRLSQMIGNELSNTNSYLYTFYTEHQDGNIQHSLLTGFDCLLTNYTEIEGQYTDSTRVPFSPPNAFVAGHGPVSYTATGSGRPATAAYETYLRERLATLIGKTDMGMTVDRLEAAAMWANERNIEQYDTPLGPATIVIMDTRQFWQLTKSDGWKETYRLAGPRDKSNPLFSKATAFIGGCLIYVANGLFGVKHNAGTLAIDAATSGNSALGMPQYGPDNYWVSADGTVSGMDSNSIKIAHIIGKGALHKIYGRIRHQFLVEEGDFKRREEAVHESFSSLCRGDMIDINNEYGNGASAFFGNRGHAVLFTWSPPVTGV